MALSDLKTVTLTKADLLVLEELICDYANHPDSDVVGYGFRVSEELRYSEDDMEALFDKLTNARFSK